MQSDLVSKFATIGTLRIDCIGQRYRFQRGRGSALCSHAPENFAIVRTMAINLF